jgi:hypothetical protein
MLDFAKFSGKMFLIYCKGSNDSRTPVGVLLLSFRDILFASICEGTRWAWYTLVQGHKQFILDQ